MKHDRDARFLVTDDRIGQGQVNEESFEGRQKERWIQESQSVVRGQAESLKHPAGYRVRNREVQGLVRVDLT